MNSSVGMMKFPTEWKVIKFHGSKPPTRTIYIYMPQYAPIDSPNGWFPIGKIKNHLKQTKVVMKNPCINLPGNAWTMKFRRFIFLMTMFYQVVIKKPSFMTLLPSGKHTKNYCKWPSRTSWFTQLEHGGSFQFANCRRLPGRVYHHISH